MLLYACGIACALFGFQNLAAQDVRKDLSTSYAQWKALERYSFNVRFDLYATGGSIAPYETMRGHVVCDGNRFLSNFNGIVTRQDSRVMVVRDDVDRSIVVRPRMTEMPSPYNTMGPDSLLAWSSGQTLLREDSVWRVHRLEYPSGRDYTSAELHVHKPSGLVLHIRLELANAVDLDPADGLAAARPRLDLVIEALDRDPNVDRSLFDTSDTITHTPEGWKPNPSISDYALVELLP